MKAIVLTAVAAAVLTTTGLANAAGEEDAKKAGCLGCHALDKKKVGPAFKDVAAMFKGKSADDVVAGMKSKGPHKNVKASDAELKEIAAWVLTVK
jgi:cytochrome c